MPLTPTKIRFLNTNGAVRKVPRLFLPAHSCPVERKFELGKKGWTVFQKSDIMNNHQQKGCVIFMKCPFCGDQESKVVDSRHSEDGLSIRRRRECMACQRRFTTYEIVESLPIIVVKRNGSRQSFDRNKILNSMIRAFDKRKVNVEDLDKITTEIEQTIQNSLEREISTDKIGEMILERLKPLDEVAYIRFASVYRRFQDVNSFMREISTLLEE